MTKILFMGRKEVSSTILQWLVGLPDVNVVGVLTDSHLEGSAVASVAIANGLKLFGFDDALQSMKSGELDFDLGISVLYWRKLKEEFISIPCKGVINFHPAILPEYKGTGGYNLAILDQLSEWGISAHYVDESIDTGAIIDVSKFRIEPNTETAQSLESTTMSKMKGFVINIIQKALESDALLMTTENVGGRYLSRPQMEALKEIVPGDDIDRKIRAFWFPPYHGASITINEKKYTLVNEKILHELSPKGSTSLFTEGSD